MRVARVLPNVTGLHKLFDYRIPDDMPIDVGWLVRVPLHGRRVGGWVVGLVDAVDAAVDAEALKPIAKVTGHGPDQELIELGEWAAIRWAGRSARPFLVVASPDRAVISLPPDRRTSPTLAPSSPATNELFEAGGGVLRLPPRSDVLPAIRSAINRGPTLVVTPTVRDARLLASRLRRSGASVSLLPDEWAAAAAGTDVVVGPRSAAWGPCAGLAVGVVIDEHDEAHHEERTPTWHARDVVVERCRRAGVPHLVVSPSPSVDAIETAAGRTGVVHPPAARERAGWPRVTVVDRSDDEPWRRSLVTSPLIEWLRTPDSTVVCVSNITGRARVLACRSCRSLIRCERCDAAIGLRSDNRLECRRCGVERPPVCQHCGASQFANLRPGITRLREELEGAAARPVVEVSAAADDVLDAPIYVGTEAVLHRVREADVVVFLEFDSEMLAPRFRAAEQAMSLIVRAGRIAPDVLIQTFTPEHEVIRAAVAGDPGILADVERERRALLSLPPFGALAAVSGSGAEQYLERLAQPGIEIGAGDPAIVRAADWTSLGRALNGVERPPGSRLRIAVDAPRL